MNGPVLRAVVENGDAYDDPSPGLLLEVLADLDAGRDRWVVVRYLAEVSGQTYAQVVRFDDGQFEVETRHGPLAPPRVMPTGDVQEAHGLLEAWMSARVAEADAPRATGPAGEAS